MTDAALRVRETRELAPLFEERTELRAVVDSVIEGHLGRAWADRVDRPRVARLDLGCYSVLGGDPSSSSSRELVAAVAPPVEPAFPDSNEWRGLIREVHGAALSDRSMQSFSPADADAGWLAQICTQLPAGYSIARVDPAVAARLGPEHEPHAMQVFDDPEDFVARGVGFFATDGVSIACVATSYAICSHAIELSIATHPGHRRRGLARAVAARLTLHCLERGVLAHWNAANPVSQRLALQLGYRRSGTCEILFVRS